MKKKRILYRVQEIAPTEHSDTDIVTFINRDTRAAAEEILAAIEKSNYNFECWEIEEIDLGCEEGEDT